MPETSPPSPDKPDKDSEKKAAAVSLFSAKKKGGRPQKESAKDTEISVDALDNWNISLMIDTFDDIFSDFDARHYSERALSQDFLEECKRASIGKVEKGLEIRIMTPSSKRDEIAEGLIKHRLKRHFQKYYQQKLEALSKVKREGFIFTSIGVLFLFLAGIVYSWEASLTVHLLLVLLEPGGWFLAWTGLDTLRAADQKVPDLGFYKKMSEAEFIFISY